MREPRITSTAKLKNSNHSKLRGLFKPQIERSWPQQAAECELNLEQSRKVLFRFFWTVARHGRAADDHDVPNGLDELVGDDNAFGASKHL